MEIIPSKVYRILDKNHQTASSLVNWLKVALEKLHRKRGKTSAVNTPINNGMLSNAKSSSIEIFCPWKRPINQHLFSFKSMATVRVMEIHSI